MNNKSELVMNSSAGTTEEGWTSQVQEQLRAVAFAILAFGVMMTLISIFADPLALGLPDSGFGWKQVTGTLAGLVFAALGYVLIAHFSDDGSNQQ